MDERGGNRGTAWASRRGALLAAWLARTLDTYPPSARDFLTRERDAFRNPVGQALREGLANLLDGLLDARAAAELLPELEPVERLRAVQDYTPSQALAFLFLLKDVLREAETLPGGPATAERETIEERLDQLMLAAFDLYMRCREDIWKIEVNAAKRSLFVPLRRGEREAAG